MKSAVKLFPGGPNIPVKFLNRLQEGKVVFFCGAGVSLRSGLPDFKGLVKELCSEFGAPFNGRRRDYDRMLEELENDYPGQVREKVRDILAPKEDVSARRLENHRNLLRLAAVPSDDDSPVRVRLVTTNFDDRFIRAGKSMGISIIPDDAPKLPVPENIDEWASLVHLHGRIAEDERTLKSLVLTSSDFGRAYLIQGWARRFIVQLLREWHVAFVGYGLSDPPMRYLMDAADAIRRNNPSAFCKSYVFVPYSGREEDAHAAWQPKEIVTPIFYRKGKGAGAHSPLWKTLGEMAAFKNNPIEFRQKIVRFNKPKLVLDGDITEQVTWALKDPATVQTFAERKFMPDAADADQLIEWLDAFKKAGLFRADNVAPVDALDSMPRSPHGAPGLPPVAGHLVRWVARHAHQPALLWWLVGLDEIPHPHLVRELEYSVNRMGNREGANKMPEQLAERWNLYLQERLDSSPCGFLFDGFFTERVKSEWANSNLDQRILAALRPFPRVVRYSPFWRFGEREKFGVEVEVGCEIDKAGGAAYSAREHAKESNFVMTHAEALAAHLESAASLMKHCGIDTISLRCFRPEEDDHYDPPHWLFLALQVRDAVLGMIEGKEISRLKNLVDRWTASEHLLLRRFALFAMAETAQQPVDARLPVDEGAKMMTECPDILWALESSREICRFLRKAGAGITPSVRAELERVIRNGPRHEKCRSDMDEEEINTAIRWEVAKFLAKLELSGADLSPESVRALAAARAADPATKFENFMEYHIGKAVTTWQAADPDAPGWPGAPKQPAPEWAKMAAKECADHIQSAEWPLIGDFVKNHPDKAAESFEILAGRGFWDSSKWERFLDAFGRSKDISIEIAVRLIPLLEAMPDELACGLVSDCVRFLEAISQTRPFSEMERAWRKLWNFDLDPRQTVFGDHHISKLDIAINHSHGRLAEIPLRCFGSGNQEKLLEVLAEILASEKPSHMHGKIAIGSRLFPLFHNYPEWTKRHLLPFFAPEHPMAFGMWEAFLYNPRVSRGLILAIKPGLMHFIGLVDDFDERAYNLVGTFIAGCLLYPEVVPLNEKRRAVEAMSPQGIAHLCWHMERELRNGDGVARAKTWRELIFPFLRDVWPQKRRPPGEVSDISKSLASLIILTGDAFSEAFQWAKGFLSRIVGHGPMHPVMGLFHGRRERATDIPAQFPRECLLFLNRIVPDDGFHHRYELRIVLDKIQKAAPDLEKHPAFIRLRRIASGG